MGVKLLVVRCYFPDKPRWRCWEVTYWSSIRTRGRWV